MTFQTEFPDFPVETMPTIPAGFTDTSWKNDTCPSFAHEALGLLLFVDYADKAQREFDDTPRFSLATAGDDREEIIITDNWQAVLVEVEGRLRTLATDHHLKGDDATCDRYIDEADAVEEMINDLKQGH